MTDLCDECDRGFADFFDVIILIGDDNLRRNCASNVTSGVEKRIASSRTRRREHNSHQSYEVKALGSNQLACVRSDCEAVKCWRAI